MSVIADTSVLVAFLNTKDHDHARARHAMDRIRGGEHGTAIGLDVVLDEGLTLLRSRFPVRAVAEEFANWFWGTRRDRPMLHLVMTDEARLREATDLYFRHARQGLSFTDAVIMAHAARLGAQVATFDTTLAGLCGGLVI